MFWHKRSAAKLVKAAKPLVRYRCVNQFATNVTVPKKTPLVPLFIDDRNCNFELAAERLVEAIRLDPQNAEALYWQGRSLLRLGHSKRATSHFEKALALPDAWHPVNKFSLQYWRTISILPPLGTPNKAFGDRPSIIEWHDNSDPMEVVAALRRTNGQQPHGWVAWEAPQSLAQQILDACCWECIFRIREADFTHIPEVVKADGEEANSDFALFDTAADIAKALNGILKIDPQDLHARFWSGFVYECGWKLEEAAKHYGMVGPQPAAQLSAGRALVRASLNNFGSNPHKEDERSEPTFDQGRLGRAITYLDGVLNHNEKNAEAYFWRALAFFIKGTKEAELFKDYDYQHRGWKSAFDDLSRVVELHPTNASAYYWRGRIWLFADGRAVDGDDKRRVYDFNKAIELVANEDNEDADAGLRRRDFYGWSIGDAYFHRAEARNFNQSVNAEESIADLSKAIDLRTIESIRAAEVLAYWLMEKGSYTETINRICQVLGDATHLDCNFVLHDISEMDGRGADSHLMHKHLKENRSADGRLPRLYILRGKAHFLRGITPSAKGNPFGSATFDFRAARDNFDAAIQIDQRCADAHYWRGRMFAHENDFSTAIACYSQAIGYKHYGMEDCYYYRGQAYEQIGNRTAAINDYQQTLSHDREHEGARTASAALAAK